MDAGNVRDGNPNPVTPTIDFDRVAGVRGEDASRRTSPTPATRLEDPLALARGLRLLSFVIGAMFALVFLAVLLKVLT